MSLSAPKRWEKMMRPRETASLVRFGCISRTPPGMPEAALRRIARAATERNRSIGLTGELRYGEGELSQVIEGPCDTVLVVASEIIADARHEAIEVTEFEPIAARGFARWQVVGLDDSPAYCMLRPAIVPVAPPPVRAGELPGGWAEVAADGRA